MIYGNVKQWWVPPVLALLTSLTFSLAFERLVDYYPDFEELRNESFYNTDYYRSARYEKLYDNPHPLLEWIDNFTSSKSCQAFWSCSNAESNASKAEGSFCFCDKLCTMFRDCCEDKWMTNGLGTTKRTEQIQNEDEIESKMKSIQIKRLEPNVYKCHYNSHGKNFMYMITACPKKYTNSEIKQKCENPEVSDRLLHVPVSGLLPGFENNNETIKFYNLYCALCHRVSIYELWQPKFECYNLSDSAPDMKEIVGKYTNQNHTIDDIENRFKCQQRLFVNPSNMKPRECFPFDDVCRTENREEVKLLCRQGPFHPVFLPNVAEKIFRNIHCAYCNGVNYGDLTCNRSDFEPPNFNFYDTSKGGLSKLYNFNIFKLSCDKHEIYDFYRGICRAIVSPNSQTCEENDIHRQDPTSSCPNCQLIKLDENEYIHTGDTIYFQKAHLTINKSLLHFINDKPYICAEHYTQNNNSQSYMVDRIEVCITIIGLTLSILALLFTFGVYACFTPLRNVPGKMSMNLVASLFLANLLFIFSNDRLVEVICIVVAVCMHYIYLVSFFWMNALSFDAWNTFSKSTIGGRSKHCYKYYVIYCWITPLLIVSVSIFVQFTPVDVFPSWMSPKYGPPLCWITNKWALLIFFAVPLFLLILCNVVFYILTIHAINRTEKFSDRMLSKKNKGMFLIYLKLCFIMGINWIFALLDIFTGIAIIRYISVFLNSFQGFLVGCSYLFSKQVSRQLKERLAFMFRSTERTDSDLSRSKQTSGTYVSGMKTENDAEKFMRKT